MTTVAYKDGVLASDSTVVGEGRRGSVLKVAKVENNLVGACGDAELVSWFLNNFSGKMFNKVNQDPYKTICNRRDSDFQGLVISAKGKIHLVEESLIPFEIDAPFIAIGSGEHYAMGAMAAGKTAVEAVKIAAQYDINTGGKIQQVAL